MVIWTFYQCPSLPCPLLLDLADTGAGCRRVPPGVAPSFAFAPGASGFLSPAQCAWLESNPAPENPVGGCCGFVICFVDT